MKTSKRTSETKRMKPQHEANKRTHQPRDDDQRQPVVPLALVAVHIGGCNQYTMNTITSAIPQSTINMRAATQTQLKRTGEQHEFSAGGFGAVEGRRSGGGEEGVADRHDHEEAVHEAGLQILLQ